MADVTTQSHSSNSQSASSEGTEITPGRRSLPPKRGMLRRLHAKGGSDKRTASAGQTRTRITREEATGGKKIKRSQPARAESQRTGRPVAKKDFIDPGAERMKRDQEISKKQEEQKKLEEEKIKQAEARKEQNRLAREEAKRKAEEIRKKKIEAARKRKAEQEKIRKEREEERKRLEEERLKKEKELELKRLEEEKERKEKEKQRILKSIETNFGNLNDNDKEKAQKIADEIVDRNIVWTGYISLTSGIGAAVLRDQ